MLESNEPNKRKRMQNDADDLVRSCHKANPKLEFYSNQPSTNRLAWGSAIVLTTLVAALTCGYIKSKIAEATPEPEPIRPAMVATSTSIPLSKPIDYNQIIRTNFNHAIQDSTSIEDSIKNYEAITEVAKDNSGKVTTQKFRRLFDDAFFAL